MRIGAGADFEAFIEEAHNSDSFTFKNFSDSWQCREATEWPWYNAQQRSNAENTLLKSLQFRIMTFPEKKIP